MLSTVWIVWRQYSGGKALVDVCEDEDGAVRARDAYELHEGRKFLVTSHAVTPSRAKVATP